MIIPNRSFISSFCVRLSSIYMITIGAKNGLFGGNVSRVEPDSKPKLGNFQHSAQTTATSEDSSKV